MPTSGCIYTAFKHQVLAHDVKRRMSQEEGNREKSSSMPSRGYLESANSKYLHLAKAKAIKAM